MTKEDEERKRYSVIAPTPSTTLSSTPSSLARQQQRQHVPDDHMKSNKIGPPEGSKTLRVEKLTLESGVVMRDVLVCYSTYGKLNETGTNCVLVGHSLTSNSNVDEWWSEFLGDDGDEEVCSLNLSKDFIVCINYLGSPYGTASPVSENPADAKGQHYGSSFPTPVTIRDNVNLQKMTLERLGVKKLAMCIGGSMGAMLALEFAASFPDFVDKLVLIAGCGKHTDWAIGIGEAQRHSIISDANFLDGDYDIINGGPKDGLATSRMMAMLSYRAPVSMDEKFARMNVLNGELHPARSKISNSIENNNNNEDDGEDNNNKNNNNNNNNKYNDKTDGNNNSNSLPYWQVESYLQYQGQKFIQRFDANCYLQLTYTLDSHDVSRGREGGDYERVLSKLTHDTLVVGILSDVLYPFALQRELADCMPNAQLYTIDSPHGHDSFLIEIKSLNDVIRRWRSGENVEVRDPCEQEDFDIRTDTTSDAETLKRTIRALREELARVHGNLRRARTRADIYLQKLQSYGDTGGLNNLPHGVVQLSDPAYLTEGFTKVPKKGPVFGELNKKTSHAGV
jgi:homoserine O-acetyltransferase